MKYLQCACMNNVFAFLSTLYSYAVYYCSLRKLLFHLTGALKGLDTQLLFPNIVLQLSNGTDLRVFRI